MRRTFLTLVALILATVLLMPLSASSPWSTAQKAMESVVQLRGPNPDGSHYRCSAFSINKDQGYFLTDHHCLPQEGVQGDVQLARGFGFSKLYANARVLKASAELDLAVLQTGYHMKALHPRTSPFARGISMAAAGHAWGLERLYFVGGSVAYLGPIPEWTANGVRWEGEWLLFDRQVIGGMSGGPFLDTDGKVMGIVQRTNDSTGFGRPIDLILSFTKEYWQYSS